MYNTTLFEELYFRWHRSDPHFDPLRTRPKNGQIKKKSPKYEISIKNAFQQISLHTEIQHDTII